ncbi:MAG: damage-inducible protein DinB [Flavobacteriaceae bacterium]|nr:damage-inducible protein DinB [Flavobacteriaceae bacterium]|tara:strand:- start:137 stop:652 length:516 start_codon:yes stop_codon:yes gene_type:complete
MTPGQLDRSKFHPYYEMYLGLVEETSILDALDAGRMAVTEFFEKLPSEKLAYRYAADKWTPKEVLQHLVDTERVFGYRAMFASRSPDAELSGFDHDAFVVKGNANDLSIAELVREYVSVRTSSIYLFKILPPNTFANTAVANGNLFSVSALGYVMAGHEKHHINIIKERYL